MKNGKQPDAFRKMVAFINHLDEYKIYYTIDHHRVDTMMILVAIPGQRWEVEFFEDGSVEVEKFVSNGDLADESALASLFGQEPESALVAATAFPYLQELSFAD